MFLSYLSRKEKLKFLDLAIYMVDIDGEPTLVEKRILTKMLAEVDDVRSEYTFQKTESIEDTIDFFVNANQVVKNVVYLISNLNWKIFWSIIDFTFTKKRFLFSYL